MCRTTATPARLGPESAGASMTPEEFDAVEAWDDRHAYELIRGVLVVTPFPSGAENDPNEELGFFLRYYTKHHPLGSARDCTMTERHVPTADRRRADRVIWAGLGRLPDPRRDMPTIVVESVSAGRRDRRRDHEEKRREYLEAGVREYWVIDRFRRTLTVFRPPPAEPAELVVPEGGIYRTGLLPGFELPLGPILAVADRWRDAGADEAE